MKVGFHSPLPPAKTGVADYSAALLADLLAHGEVEVDAEHADVHLYHLGNNPLHRRVYQKALATPGVAVLHDAVLHHFLLGSLPEQEYIEEFVAQYGEWHRTLAQRLWNERASSAFDHRYFEYPMLRRVAERSRSIVVHNSAAARMVWNHAPGARVVEIPHLWEQPSRSSPEKTARFRASLGIRPEDTVFGVFGYLRESKRVLTVLEAFARVHERHGATKLLLAGSFLSRDLREAAEPLLNSPGVLYTGALPEESFWLAADSADVVINLRDPAAGETSGITIRLMGLGKPVILSEGLETAAFPDGSCMRVRRGLAESAELFEYMELGVTGPPLMRYIGARAKEHIVRYHSRERAAQLYWAELCASRG